MATTARQLFLLGFLALSAACEAPDTVRTIPDGELYFPTGLAFAPGATQQEGFLYVASSNFDRRYATGRITAIQVDAMGLPAFPAAPVAPLELPSLGTIGERWVSSLAGELAGIQNGGTFRMALPSRAEGSLLQIIDAVGTQLTCAGDGATNDCSVGAFSLEANLLSETGKPRAPAPFSVAIAPGGDTFVSSLQPADSPANSQLEVEAYVARFNLLAPLIDDSSYISLGTPIATSSVVVGSRYAFFSGQPTGLALRLIDRTDQRFFTASVENNFNLLDTRGLALSPDESKIYLVGKNPDVLLVLQTQNITASAPTITLIRNELLPAGASQVKALGRVGRGNLALVSCVGTQTLEAAGAGKGSFLVWDDDAGRLVAEVAGFGFQPYGIAVQPIGTGVRIYVGLFAEGRLAVFDMPDLNRPHELSHVALVGTSHLCLVNPTAVGCVP